jgi:hypothetical protein
MLKKIVEYYNAIKDYIVAGGIVAALVAFFTGHVFSAIIIGGLTYIFWKNQQGIDTLVGVK